MHNLERLHRHSRAVNVGRIDDFLSNTVASRSGGSAVTIITPYRENRRQVVRLHAGSFMGCTSAWISTTLFRVDPPRKEDGNGIATVREPIYELKRIASSRLDLHKVVNESARYLLPWFCLHDCCVWVLYMWTFAARHIQRLLRPSNG